MSSFWSGAKPSTGPQTRVRSIEKALLLYREQGETGERFGMFIERIGTDNFIAQLKSDDVLARKEEILAAPLHLESKATC